MAAAPGAPMSGADLMRIQGFLGEFGGGGAEAGGGGNSLNPADFSPIGLTESGDFLGHKIASTEWATFQELFSMFESSIASQNLIELAEGCTTFFMFLPNRRGFTMSLTTHNLSIKQQRFLTSKVSTFFSRPQGG